MPAMTTPLTPLKCFLKTKRSGGAAVTIVRHLRARRFASLESMLSTTPPKEHLALDDIHPSSRSQNATAITHETILHYAAACKTPLAIISLLAERYPASLVCSDGDGRYPIHIAAIYGAPPDVVSYLVVSNPCVVGVPDAATGRTPMHHVGMRYLEENMEEGATIKERDERMLDVVRILRDAAPESVNLEDIDGRNAIEYALESGANLKVLRAMQRASRDDWRKRSKNAAAVAAASVVGGGRAPPSDAAVTPELSSSGSCGCGRRRHQDLVEDMKAMALTLQREYSGSISGSSSTCKSLAGGNKALMDGGPGRVHLHRSRAEANTRAARTA